MTECLDRGIQSRRLRGIGLQHRDDHKYTRAGEHHALGRVAGDADRRDAGSAGDAQILEELLRCALVDVVTADRRRDPMPTTMRTALPQPDCIICALRPAFC